MKKRHFLKKIWETLYTEQWCFSLLQSRHLGTLHSSPNCHQLPHCIFLKSHQWSEISSLSKVILVFRKAGSHRAPDLGCRVAKSLGWFGILPKNTAQDTTHEQVHCHDEAANHQFPIVCIIKLSFHGGMFKLNTKFHADKLLHLLSHFESDGHTVHMLTQWCLPLPNE